MFTNPFGIIMFILITNDYSRQKFLLTNGEKQRPANYQIYITTEVSLGRFSEGYQKLVEYFSMYNCNYLKTLILAMSPCYV